MTYTTLPSYGKWQSDSSVLFAVRKDDIVLHRIDELLEHYWSTKDISKKFIFLSDLYFTADYWLKIYQTGPKAMEKKRQPAIYALFARLAAELCTAFGCTINGLTREFGTDVGPRTLRASRSRRPRRSKSRIPDAGRSR